VYGAGCASLFDPHSYACKWHEQALQPLRLSSAMDDATLEQMRQMKLTSGASFISFQVLAIARYAGYAASIATLLPSAAPPPFAAAH
jgi:hypothetical protein